MTHCSRMQAACKSQKRGWEGNEGEKGGVNNAGLEERLSCPGRYFVVILGNLFTGIDRWVDGGADKDKQQQQ